MQPAKVEIYRIGKPLFIAESSASNFDHLYPTIEAFCRSIAYFRTMAFNIPHRWALIVLATFLMGSRRQRTAQDNHRFHPLSAQVLLT